MLRQFTRTLSTYESNALVQNDMAEKLISLITEKAGITHNRTLEVGCGTGLLTKKFVNEFAINELYLNDLISDFDTYIKKRVHDEFEVINGDIEEINSFPNDFDLIISNATFQWFNDTKKTIEKLHSHLKQNGILAFTTFGQSHFKEIKEITNITLDYLPESFYKELSSDKFDLLHYSSEIVHLWFPDPISVLHHIKYSGVNGIETPKWTRSTLNTFCKNYEKKFTSPKGVSLSYQPVFVLLKKKG